jgi:hypothetical protein
MPLKILWKMALTSLQAGAVAMLIIATFPAGMGIGSKGLAVAIGLLSIKVVWYKIEHRDDYARQMASYRRGAMPPRPARNTKQRVTRPPIIQAQSHQFRYQGTDRTDFRYYTRAYDTQGHLRGYCPVTDDGHLVDSLVTQILPSGAKLI